MDHCESEHKNPDSYALGRDPAKANPSKSLSNATIGPCDSLLVNIYMKSKNWRKNQVF